MGVMRLARKRSRRQHAQDSEFNERLAKLLLAPPVLRTSKHHTAPGEGRGRAKKLYRVKGLRP